MLEETNLDGVKSIVRTFLYIEPQKTTIPFIVNHPIFSMNIVYTPHSFTQLDLFQEDDIELIHKEYLEIIDKSNLLNLYMIIREPYKLTFLRHSMEYLSLKDYSMLLADAWVVTENPNQDVNCPIPFLIKMFKKADKSVLMTEVDYEIYNNLPQSIRVYRGVAVGRNPKGISWTNDIEKAKWFANRFNKENEVGYVQTTVVDKSQVLAYFDTRNEKELVCDIRKSKIERLETC